MQALTVVCENQMGHDRYFWLKNIFWILRKELNELFFIFDQIKKVLRLARSSEISLSRVFRVSPTNLRRKNNICNQPVS